MPRTLFFNLHVGFVVKKVTMGQVCLRVLQLSRQHRSTTVVHTHISFLYHQRHTNKITLYLFPNTAINFCVTQFRSSTRDLRLILLKLFWNLQGHYNNDWKLIWRKLGWLPMAWIAYKVLQKYVGCTTIKERQAARWINSHTSLPFFAKKNQR
jgi:hypothetical protein